MTIRAAILAQAPVVYWPLDEIAGPTAFDNSGGGNQGQYQPNTVFQLPGPEVGTFGVGAPVPDAGVQLSGLNPVTEIAPTSAIGWLASSSAVGAGSQRFLHIGAPAANGLGLIISPGREVQVLYGGLLVVPSGLLLAPDAWHLVGFTFDGVATTLVYVDVQAPAVIGAHTPAPSLVGNPLVAETPGPFYLAHCAFWNRTLTTPQVQGIFTAAGPLNGAPFPSGGAATNFDTASLEAKLDLVLASVRQSFP